MDHGQLKVFKKKIIIEEDSSDKQIYIWYTYWRNQVAINQTIRTYKINKGRGWMNLFGQ